MTRARRAMPPLERFTGWLLKVRLRLFYGRRG